MEFDGGHNGQVLNFSFLPSDARSFQDLNPVSPHEGNTSRHMPHHGLNLCVLWAPTSLFGRNLVDKPHMGQVCVSLASDRKSSVTCGSSWGYTSDREIW